RGDDVRRPRRRGRGRRSGRGARARARAGRLRPRASTLPHGVRRGAPYRTDRRDDRAERTLRVPRCAAAGDAGGDRPGLEAARLYDQRDGHRAPLGRLRPARSPRRARRPRAPAPARAPPAVVRRGSDAHVQGRTLRDALRLRPGRGDPQGPGARGLGVEPVELGGLAITGDQPQAIATAALERLAFAGEPLARLRHALAEGRALVARLRDANAPSARARVLREQAPVVLAWLWL